jgi:glucose-6-phosphate 1-dehydrogenase
MVIFGAAGDLAQRLLMPAVYDLAAAGLLDPGLKIIGADHNDRDAAGWRNEIGDALHQFAAQPGSEFHTKSVDEKAWGFVSERMDYVRFDFTKPDDFAALAKRLDDAGSALFYLAVSPHFFESIAEGLAHAGLFDERDGRFRRLIIEKPFGRDLASARELNAKLTSLAKESQLYRIDHFLGKDAVQGIPALRFANRAFEPLLQRDTVASVQITAAETVGVEERGAFYESVGALRDMVPNHLFSLLTLVAMEQPRTFGAEDVRDAKNALLAAIRPVAPGDAVRGQYVAGTLAGAAARAYREEENVAHDSRTETYAAIEVRIDNDRWRDVPFYIRTGKRMSAHVTTIALTLHAPAGPLDPQPAGPQLLLFGIDPQRGLVQRFAAKRPGVDLQLGGAGAVFRYDTTFTEPPNVGYETLLYHAMCGDPTNFQRDDMIDHEWAALAPVLDAWDATTDDPAFYPAGTDGPAAADALLARNGDRWLDVAPLETLGAPAPG